MDKIERIKELIQILNSASDAYYNTDKPTISDQEFDKMFDELKQCIINIPNKRIKNLTNEKYYDLIVLGYVGKNKRNQAIWLCKCICKKFKLVPTTELKNGHIKSCGCRNLRMLQERNKNNTYGKTHGLSRNKIYKVRQGMIERCYNKKSKGYKNYGGRGIKICNEWLNKEDGFLNFYYWANNNGYEEGLTIERINVNGNYCPENCTWITNKEQQNNKTNNVWITLDGETLNMRQWSNAIGINEKTIEFRKRSHWKEKDLLNPVNKEKIPLEDKKQIIKLFDSNKYSMRKIGRMFDVSHTTISDIIQNRLKYEEEN